MLACECLLVLGLLVYKAGELWLPFLGSALIAADPLARADVVVPLAGERSRVFYAAQLFRQGLAGWYAITDMVVTGCKLPVARCRASLAAASTGDGESWTRYTESVRDQALTAGVPLAAIVRVPGTADTTYHEALNLRQVALARGWHSLLVVTSPFHSRRARLIFGDVFRGTGIRVSVQPAEPHWYRPETWWTTPEGRQATAEEYLKFALYFVGYEKLLR